MSPWGRFMQAGAVMITATLAVGARFPEMAEGARAQHGIEGTWQGTLVAGSVEYRLVFHIRRSDGGDLSGTMDSPDQGAFELPLSAVEAHGEDVRFAIASIGGEYTGRISDDGASIAGEWAQSGMQFPLDLVRTGEEEAVRARPQEPEPPLPYRADDVTFANPDAGIRLAGTFTVPPEAGPHPAVVLITGSGAQDRDETVFGHRPFLVLADHLTRAGISVLRYDDRGTGESSGDFATATTEDFVTDARAAVAWLAERPEVDPARIGLVGHSEGAIVAPLVANRSGGVAFVVLLASSGVPGRDLLVMQLIAINRAQGAAPSVIEARSRLQRRLLDIVAGTSDDGTTWDRARAILTGAGLTGEAADAQVRALLSPWMRFFLTYDPLPALRELRVPVLALNGQKDVQVPPDGNLDRVEEALREGGNSDYTVRELPGLNHLFQTAQTGSPTEYARIEETMSPVALQTITEWIAGQADLR